MTSTLARPLPSTTVEIAPVRLRSVPSPTAPHVATAGLQLSTKAAALVLRTARVSGPVFRDDTAAATGLSISTVNRQVSALLKAGLIRERADLTPPGAVGRPRVPFEINTTGFLTVGIHIGYKTTSITTHDLMHRVVGAIAIPTPQAGTPEEVVAAVGASARRFADRWVGKRLLWAGVAIGGRVAEGGVVDHPRLGWSNVPVGRVIAETIGLPVSVASHVEAMAAAELVVNTPSDQSQNFLYFYAREMVGIAFSVDGTVHTPAAGPPTIGHFPTGETTLLDPDRTGRLEDTVGDSGVLYAAEKAGLSVSSIDELRAAARTGNTVAHDILTERAEILGRTVALISDIFNPDHVILGGQAFTDYPEALPAVSKALRATSVVTQRDVRVARSAITVQQKAAGAVALDAIYADPLDALSHTA
ncbi:MULTISPECIES: ROK family transcriptional regulator [Gordonia]|jgi:predicted NBD/HSP70 family sugar kinase|uniref:Putative NagC family transcriptional regulator n=2 Tax=Bacillati TaxID=1783272 RepID=M3UHN8_GORML|nr:ROK family transcriptional regulator [Gordonia malaquae]GAC78900.1 putative NagC family transcriptional regulator [Gordonia malaquae NBRC 108250]SEB58341.1 Sugar kinase of the NBD/HSP70 family, may contain an N-terminal HTH domain [Gordonia malaquae]